MKNYYRFIDKIAYKFDIKRRMERANNRAARKTLMKLSDSEKKQVCAEWGNIVKFVSHEFYKGFGLPFNPQLVPNDYYDFAEHVLNLRWAAFFLQHKCNLKYIIPSTNRPKTIIQKIDGHYVFEDNSEISEDEAFTLLKNRGTFVCKIALGSGGGKNVRKISCDGTVKTDDVFERIRKSQDLIFQDIIQQSEFMSMFNPDSVNTIRLLTLNINGNCSVCSSFIRMGGKGSFVDNLSSGKGALVGISQDGCLSEYGITKKYARVYESPTGIAFKDLKIPDWNKIKETILDFHRHIPHANLIGWDVAIDKEGTPIVVEINLDSAEIEAHQVFNGPVFGNRLDEVKQYINEKMPLLRHAMITY